MTLMKACLDSCSTVLGHAVWRPLARAVLMSGLGLLALAPAFLLLSDWSLNNVRHPAKPSLDVLLYLAFLLPLFGPLAHWTHLQLSVVVFVAMLWSLYRIATTSHKLAFAESAVV